MKPASYSDIPPSLPDTPASQSVRVHRIQQNFHVCNVASNFSQYIFRGWYLATQIHILECKPLLENIFTETLSWINQNKQNPKIGFSLEGAKEKTLKWPHIKYWIIANKIKIKTHFLGTEPISVANIYHLTIPPLLAPVRNTPFSNNILTQWPNWRFPAFSTWKLHP